MTLIGGLLYIALTAGLMSPSLGIGHDTRHTAEAPEKLAGAPRSDCMGGCRKADAGRAKRPVPYFCRNVGQGGIMFRGFILGRIAPLALIAGPLALGLPVKAGAAFVLGALAGLAFVLPFALALRLIGVRQVLGWPLWLLRIAFNIVLRRRLV